MSNDNPAETHAEINLEKTSTSLTLDDYHALLPMPPSPTGVKLSTTDRTKRTNSLLDMLDDDDKDKES